VSDNNLKAGYKGNLDAFAEPATADQERLLRSSVAEDITFSNPGATGRVSTASWPTSPNPETSSPAPTSE